MTIIVLVEKILIELIALKLYLHFIIACLFLSNSLLSSYFFFFFTDKRHEEILKTKDSVFENQIPPIQNPNNLSPRRSNKSNISLSQQNSQQHLPTSRNSICNDIVVLPRPSSILSLTKLQNQSSFPNSINNNNHNYYHNSNHSISNSRKSSPRRTRLSNASSGLQIDSKKMLNKNSKRYKSFDDLFVKEKVDCEDDQKSQSERED